MYHFLGNHLVCRVAKKIIVAGKFLICFSYMRIGFGKPNIFSVFIHTIKPFVIRKNLFDSYEINLIFTLKSCKKFQKESGKLMYIVKNGINKNKFICVTHCVL